MTTLSLDDCIGHLDSGFSGLVHFNDYMSLVEHPPAAGGAAGHVVQRGGDKAGGGKKGEQLSRLVGWRGVVGEVSCLKQCGRESGRQ